MKLEAMGKDELLELGLDVHDIAIHQERIQASLALQDSSYLPIADTCRLDNGGILPQRYLKTLSEESLHGFVAFVPAAGAASRYFQPLQSLRSALADAKLDLVSKLREDLVKQAALSWPLPRQLYAFLSSQAPLSAEHFAPLIEEIDAPKALLPCSPAGPSFLLQKQSEHSQIPGLEAQVFVAPLGQAGRFAQELRESRDSEHIPTICLEQGPHLSTLRFERSGLPYRDQKGDLSLVPAGHGMLVKLLPDIHKQFPQAHSLFIRNIDNVNGSSPEVLAATELFLRQHLTLLGCIKRIRKALHDESITEAARLAKETLDFCKLPTPGPSTQWLRELPEPWHPLWELLLHVLHCPAELASRWRDKHGDNLSLRRLYDRPFNSLGQVPNNGKDVGGTPVYTQTKEGLVSLCLELPHASPADKQRFLEDPSRATHFNPVFVAAEIPKDAHAYDLKNCPFWILAQKQLHGQDVVYHETVLYEVLGNSITANLVFPEIPRLLFYPHKTLQDGVSARR